MARLSDLPEFYAVVVILPAEPGSKPTTMQVNGRIARFFAWMLDHRPWIEAMRGGHLEFDYYEENWTPGLKEKFSNRKVRRADLTDEDTRGVRGIAERGVID